MINKLKTWWQRQMKGPDKVDTKTIVIALLFLLFALIFSWIEITSNMGDVRFNNEEAHVLEGQWKVSYNGKTTTTTLPSKVEAS